MCWDGVSTTIPSTRGEFGVEEDCVDSMCIDGALAGICGLVLIRATEDGLRRAETTIVVGRDVYMIGKAFVRRSSD